MARRWGMEWGWMVLLAAGSASVANVVMLGAVLRQSGLVERSSLWPILDQLAHNDPQRELNRRALLAGERALEKEGGVPQSGVRPSPIPVI
jgi:Pyruvate/2-oxoacid:ferredoxin oxidoreductase gamma subunit